MKEVATENVLGRKSFLQYFFFSKGCNIYWIWSATV